MIDKEALRLPDIVRLALVTGALSLWPLLQGPMWECGIEKKGRMNMTAFWLCMLLQYFDNEDALQLIGPSSRDEANYGYSTTVLP